MLFIEHNYQSNAWVSKVESTTLYLTGTIMPQTVLAENLPKCVTDPRKQSCKVAVPNSVAVVKN
jgi:hypothetical protein